MEARPVTSLSPGDRVRVRREGAYVVKAAETRSMPVDPMRVPVDWRPAPPTDMDRRVVAAFLRVKLGPVEASDD